MRQYEPEVLAEASRRAAVTGSSFRHSLRRESMRRRRQIEAGKLNVTGNSQEPSIEVPPNPTQSIETEIPTPGIQSPQVPTPGLDNPGGPDPVAETSGSETGAEDAKKKPARSTKKKTEDAEKSAAPKKTDTANTAAEAFDTVEDDAEFKRKQKNIGLRVGWSAFGKALEGTLHAVIPAGKTPRQVGVEAGGDKSPARDHHSYVVAKEDGSLVWPASNALKPLGNQVAAA